MVDRVRNSFALVKASANVLRLDKELMVFPLLSGISTILVMATFIVPIFVTEAWVIFGENPDQANILATGIGFLFYVTQYSVIFFFNAALVGAALIRLDGGDPTVADGLAIASKRMGSIIGYAVIAATVGMILRFLSERAGFIGKIIIGLIGMAWTLMTFLTVPVLVTKDIGPIDAVKESGLIFRRTWGEQVAGNFALSWALFFIGLGWTTLMIGAIWLTATLSLGPIAIGSAIGVGILGYVMLGLFGSALNGIYTAALYRYAMTGEVHNFDTSIMGNAFRPK